MGSNENKKDDDPIADQSGSGDTSRRNFLKYSVAVSALLAVGGIAAISKSITDQALASGTGAPTSFPRFMITNISSLRVSVPVSFNYPLDNEPNYLVKLGQKAEGGIGPDQDIVAFSQVCQHLGCLYGFQETGSSPHCDSSYKAPGPLGYCCCHGSIYDFLNEGKVLGGPAPRPIPMVILEIDTSGNIYATGMTPPSIFAHDTGSSDVTQDLQGGTLV